MSLDEAVIVLAWAISTVVILGLGVIDLAVRAWRWLVAQKDAALNGAAEEIR